MFITFVQNNSGGYLIQNEDVDNYVIIEGDNLSNILERANIIFKPYRRYCECCGERWGDDYVDETDLDEEPMIYDESVYNVTDTYYKGSKAIIYRMDGAKEVVEL